MSATPAHQRSPRHEAAALSPDAVRIFPSGEMARRIASFDWASTPLGPIESWPETLLSSVNLILAAQFPMIVAWGPELTVLYNDAHIPLLADKHPVILGSPAAQSWPEAWHTVGPRLEDALLRGRPTSEQNVLIPVRRHGRLADVYWTYNYSPIFDPSGEIAGVLVVSHDVTGEVLATRERDSFAQRLSQLLDATSDSVMILDRDWRIVYLNRRGRNLLAPAGELLGRNAAEIFAHDDSESASPFPVFSRAMHDGIPGEFDAFYCEPLNLWLHCAIEPCSEGVIVLFRDVTSEKQSEIVLRESVARMDAIYNTSLEYIGLLTISGIVLDCNRASLEFAGNTREQLIGKYFWQCPWWTYTPGAPEKLQEAIARAAAGEHVRYEVPLNRPTGETTVFDFSLSPVRDPEGNVIYLVPEARDITHVKRTEAALKDSEKLAVVGRLAASIAHEINNPLEAVTNLLYLCSQTNRPNEVRRYLQLAERELRRASAITSQTLRFYRQSTLPRSIDLRDLVINVLSIHQGRILNSRVAVETRFRAEQTIACFEGEIRQVLINLIGNAIDAMRSAGGRLLVRTRSATHQPTGRRGLVVTVADSGDGIDPAHLRRIFEPFFTTKGISGTGLGLWVSHEIVQRHQGIMRVRSSRRPASSGTVFTLFLPLDATALDPSPSPAS